MTELNPEIILQANDTFAKMPTYGDVMQERTRVKAQQQAQAEHNAAYAKQQADQQRQVTLGQMAAGGDVQGASKAALGEGDLDLANHFTQMAAGQRQQIAQKVSLGAQALYGISKLPPEQRKQALAGAAPGLIAQGYTPEELAKMPLDDAGIQGALSNALSLSDQIKSAETAAQLSFKNNQLDETARHNRSIEGRPVVLGQGSVLYSPGSTTPSAPPTPTGGKPALPYSATQMKDLISNAIPGAGFNSGYRTPEHNAEVGGKPNSMHTRGTGEAYDLRPAPGETMGQLYARVQRSGIPFTEILNEGDHVHVGWGAKGGKAAPAATGGRIIANNPKPAVESGTPVLSDAAIENAAVTYNEKGSLPSMGLGKSGAALKARILNRAAEIANSNGDNATALLARQAARKANTQALGDLTKRNSVMSSAKDTAIANGNLLVSASRTGAGTMGGPMFNKWQQAYRQGVQGSPEVAKFGLAVNTFANEYAKVISGATGAAGVAEGARQEMLHHLSTASTPEQVAAIVQQAKLEMASSTNALHGQLQTVQNALRGGGNRPPGPAVGTVKGGYRYKGGDPANPQSWVKQ